MNIFTIRYNLKRNEIIGFYTAEVIYDFKKSDLKAI